MFRPNPDAPMKNIKQFRFNSLSEHFEIWIWKSAIRERVQRIFYCYFHSVLHLPAYLRRTFFLSPPKIICLFLSLYVSFSLSLSLSLSLSVSFSVSLSLSLSLIPLQLQDFSFKVFIPIHIFISCSPYSVNTLCKILPFHKIHFGAI